MPVKEKVQAFPTIICRLSSPRRRRQKGCGVSRQTINAIENNKYDPSQALAFHLARELETTVDALFIPVP